MKKITISDIRIIANDEVHELWFAQGMDTVVIDIKYRTEIIKALEKLGE